MVNYNEYTKRISKQVDDAVASSQLCMAVIELIGSEENKNNEWKESIPTDLLEKLSDIALVTLKLKNLTNRKYWPQSPSSLSYNLNKVKTTLREKGIEVRTGDKNKNGKRVIKLIKWNPSFSSNIKTSSTSSTSSNDDKSSTKQGKIWTTLKYLMKHRQKRRPQKTVKIKHKIMVLDELTVLTAFFQLMKLLKKDTSEKRKNERIGI